MMAFKQFGEHPELIWMSIGIIFSIGSFNSTGVAITKHASAAQRSTVDTCRTLLIWLISMGLKWEVFHAAELVGFFMLVGGTLVYNEIIIIPIDMFSRNTKLVIAKREGKLDAFMGDDSKRDFISTSPAAPYDKQRFNRNLDNKLHERENLIA